MKIQILSLLSISLINLSRCQNIISPTNYTLSYLENIDMLQMNCTVDSDCPQYSKCENVTDGNKTYSLCKFGDFLCPERTVDYYTLLDNSNETCSYIDSTVYDLEKELIKESFSSEIKPILKICPKNNPECTTDKCTKNSDCLSGVCLNNSCVNNDNMNHDIYRCSVNDQDKFSMKCKKVNGMSCGNDSECYSNICTYYDSKRYDSKYCSKSSSSIISNHKNGYSTAEIILYSIMFVVLLLVIIFTILCIYNLCNDCW